MEVQGRPFDLLFSQGVVDNVSRIMELPIELQYGLPAGSRVEVKEIKSGSRHGIKFRLGTESRPGVLFNRATSESHATSRAYMCVRDLLSEREADRDDPYPYGQRLRTFASQSGISQEDIDYFFSDEAIDVVNKSIKPEGIHQRAFKNF